MADLTTSYGPDRSLNTSIPGAPLPNNAAAPMPASSFGGLPPEILQLLLARSRAQPASNQGYVGASAGRAPMGRPAYATQYEQPQQSSQPEEISRMVRDPYRSQYENKYFGAGGRMYDDGGQPKMVKERFIGGNWEFDNVDPSRQGGGGAGRIDTGTPAPGGAGYRDLPRFDSANPLAAQRDNFNIAAQQRLIGGGPQNAAGTGGYGGGGVALQGSVPNQYPKKEPK